MRSHVRLAVVCLAASLFAPKVLMAQGTPTASGEGLPAAASPRLVRYGGTVPIAADAPTSGEVRLVFSVYGAKDAVEPLWSESQWVSVESGRYQALLGATSKDGLPVELFSTGEPRWLGVRVEGGEEQPRALLVSVPYALKAVDSERLEGKTVAELLASAEVQQAIAAAVNKAQSTSTTESGPGKPVNKRLQATGEATAAARGDEIRSSGGTAAGPTNFSGTNTEEIVLVTQSGTGIAVNAQSAGTIAVQGLATAASGLSYGVVGYSSSTTGRGVRGEATALSGGATVGVQGVSHSTADGSAGLQGFQDAASGVVFGLQGSVASSGGTAIQGTATSTTGSPKGISASVVSKDGIGVYAETTSTTAGNAIGLYVKTNSNGAVGARFETPGTASGALFSGIVGGVQRFHVDNQGRLIVDAAVQGNAIQGNSLYTGSGLTTGVWGETHGPDGVGVLGIAYANSNNTAGVYADGEGTDSVALWGETFGGGASTGLIARSFSGSGTGIGAAIGYAQNPAGAAAGARILSLRNGDPYAGGGSQEVEVAYVDVNGNIHAPSFTGSGAGLTSIPGTAISGNISGTAATATALAANGANCSAGSFAAGVSATGAAEGCATAVTGVGLSAPVSDFTVSGSPVLTAGTLTLGWTVAPTDANTANAIVKRDGSGNFSGGTFTGNVTGTATNATQLNGQTASFYQARVTGSCPAGANISGVNSDGSVICGAVAAPSAATLHTVDSGLFLVAGQYTSITIGSDGLPLISYYDATNGSLKVAHCDDITCASATKSSVESGTNAGQGTSVTIGTDGLALIAYYSPNTGLLKAAHCSNVTCTSSAAYVVDSGPSDFVGKYPSVSIGSDGLPVISYYDVTAGDLRVAHCSVLDCSSATNTTLDSLGDAGQYDSIAVGTDGLPIIIYYDSFGLTLKAAHCNDVTCSGATFNTLSDVGYYTSVTIGADGLPIFSYYQPAGDLKVGHCNDVFCSSVGTYTLDSPNDTGQYTSITLGTDGLALISYYYVSGGVLRTAHCSNVLCSSATLSTVDPDLSDFVGQYTSVTIGTDGLPIISYYDATADTLKVAHCSNTLCVPYFRRR